MHIPADHFIIAYALTYTSYISSDVMILDIHTMNMQHITCDGTHKPIEATTLSLKLQQYRFCRRYGHAI